MTPSTVETGYTQWSATYDRDRNLTRDLDQLVTRATLANRRYHTVLELGCGTGKNTGFLATRADRVRALDFSEGMLAQARAKSFPAHVTFARADLTHPWPATDHSADLVTCNLVLEHIEHLAPVFAEAARTLRPAGHLFISELHPFKQYLGSKAKYQQNDAEVELPAFTHHISDFLTAASTAGLSLTTLNEWWHADDAGKPPRLVSFLFTK